MNLPDRPVTLSEFYKLIAAFLADECQLITDGHLIHKKCGGAIHVGFANLFHINSDGSLDPGHDGFGLGPICVPYCEKCNPPDSFNHAHARRIPILRVC